MRPYKFIKTIIIVLFSFLSVFCNANDDIKRIVMKDMRNAFRIVSDDARIQNSIILQMYNLSNVMRDPVVVFEIPKNKNESQSVELLHRNNFFEPTFPNVTTSRWFSKNHSREKDTWKLFDLEGWSGDIMYSHENHFSEYINNNDRQKVRRKNDILDVYIARANDPFGYSTKWEMRYSGNEGRKVKRDVANLYSMIKCSTGCEPFLYKGYGCYCGFLGSGIPVDGVDNCCKLHDKCYENSNCIAYLEYFVPYIWKCYHKKPICATDHGEWGNKRSCTARLCACDLQLSRCLRKYVCPTRRAVCKSSSVRKLQNLLLL